MSSEDKASAVPTIAAAMQMSRDDARPSKTPSDTTVQSTAGHTPPIRRRKRRSMSMSKDKPTHKDKRSLSKENSGSQEWARMSSSSKAGSQRRRSSKVAGKKHPKRPSAKAKCMAQVRCSGDTFIRGVKRALRP